MVSLNSRNLVLIFLPVFILTGLDQLIKTLILAANPTTQFWVFTINIVANKGIIGGYLSEKATGVFQIPMVTVGFFLLVCLYFIQLFAPVKSLVMRLAISLFFGGIFANVIDRMVHGYVVDFLALNLFGRSTAAFNVADLFQYVGLAMMFIWQFFPTTFDHTLSDKLWVSRQFQKRYSYQLVATGFFLMLVLGVLSFMFEEVVLQEVAAIDKARLMHSYLIFFLSTSITFLLLLFLIGKSLAAHVAKPILRFEQYLRALAAGDYQVFQLDEPEFDYLERLSDEVRDHMMEMRRKILLLETRGKKVGIGEKNRVD